MTAPSTNNSAGRRIWGLLASRPSANRSGTTTKPVPLGTEFTAIDRLYTALLVRDPNASTVAMWMPTNGQSSGTTTPSAATPGISSMGPRATAAGGGMTTGNLVSLSAVAIPVMSAAASTQATGTFGVTTTLGIALTTTSAVDKGIASVKTTAVAVTSGSYVMGDGAGLILTFAAGGGAIKQGIALGGGLAAGGVAIPVLLYQDAIL